MLRTSLTHPLQIAAVDAPGGGVVGITFCPGKRQAYATTGVWERDLGVDLQAIKDWGAGVLITLVTQAELAELRVEGLGAAARALGLTWLHLPITDVSVPTAAWQRQWAAERQAVHSVLDQRGRVVVHCKGGLGRAGTIGALILVERGMAAADALAAVRAARLGAVETSAQERYMLTAQALDRPMQARGAVGAV